MAANELRKLKQRLEAAEDQLSKLQDAAIEGYEGTDTSSVSSSDAPHQNEVLLDLSDPRDDVVLHLSNAVVDGSP
eukprot:SAG11_NODE_4738_length_1785_cov_1.191578_1_plen_75_part_00